LARGELQRVRYVLEDEELWRESWSVLDRSSEEGGQQRTLLMEQVLNVELAFLDSAATNANQSPVGGEWVDEWDRPNALPLAVEIKIEIEGFGELRRVYSIPAE
jgi:general secretion pathway protein J